MPRQARIKDEFHVYHIIMRGNERKNIFGKNEDKNRFLDVLKNMKVKYNFLLYGYCIMDNHVHLVIDDNGNDISQLVKSINISYASYYNRIYKRCGHLFQDRFISEVITDDEYLLQVSKYINLNPVKAKMVKKPDEYIWSSYNIITGILKDIRELVDVDRILSIISKSRNKAENEYIRYVLQEDDNLKVMDIKDDLITDTVDNNSFISSTEQAKELINRIFMEAGTGTGNIDDNLITRDIIIRELRRNSSLTLKQIGELVGGISESRVSKILKKS